jgi:hypothetical protein
MLAKPESTPCWAPTWMLWVMPLPTAALIELLTAAVSVPVASFWDPPAVAALSKQARTQHCGEL